MQNNALKKQNEVVVFLGAGAAFDSGLPLGNQAAKYLIQSCFKSTNLMNLWKGITNYENKKHISFWPRFEVVIKIFEEYIKYSASHILKTFLNCGISSTTLTLAKIPNIKTYLTTNFDNQIESALDINNKKYKIYTNRNIIKNISPQRSHNIKIIKLHGDGNEKDINNSLGASIEQILKRYPIDAEKKILELVRNKVLIFIGYSARDPDLFSLINKIGKVAYKIIWIGRGPLKNNISQLIATDFEYYSEGSSIALKKIFQLETIQPIASYGDWENNVDHLISSFDQQHLLSIMSELCLHRNDNYSIKILHYLQSKIKTDNIYLIFSKRRRYIQSLIHSPRRNSSDIIQYQIKYIKKLLSRCNNKYKKELLSFIAQMYWRMKNPRKAIVVLENILRNRKNINKKNIDLFILLGINKIYLGGPVFYEGINLLQKTKRVAEELNLPIQYAEASRNLAIAYIRGSDPTEAEKELIKIKSIYYEMGDYKEILKWKLNYAESLRTQRKISDSLYVLDELIPEAKLSQDMDVLLIALGNRTLCLISNGGITESIKELNNIIKITTETGTNLESKANAYYNHGWLRVIHAQWLYAISYFRAAARSYTYDYLSNERKGGALSLLGICYFQCYEIKKAKNILKIIHRDKLIPKGNMHSDYKLLKFLINSLDKSDEGNKPINEIFNEDEPEQIFYYYYHLLQKNPLNDSILATLIECAEKAKLPPFWGALERHICRHLNDIPQVFVEKIRNNNTNNITNEIHLLKN